MSLMQDKGGLSKGLKIKPIEESLAMFIFKNDKEETVRLKKRFMQALYKFLHEYHEHVEYVTHIFNLFR